MNGATGISTGLSPKATTNPCEEHPALYVAEPGFYLRNGRRKKRHRFSRGHRRDCARHHPSQVAVGGAAKVNTSRSQHFESRKRRIYEVLFAELLKLGAPSRPGVMKHWLKAEATSAAVSLSAFWRTPHFFSGNQTRKTLLFVVVPLNLPILFWDAWLRHFPVPGSLNDWRDSVISHHISPRNNRSFIQFRPSVWPSRGCC